jgi:hypothetical protein
MEYVLAGIVILLIALSPIIIDRALRQLARKAIATLATAKRQLREEEQPSGS